MEGHSTTRDLLEAAQHGRSEAWHSLYLRYRKVLRGMLKRRGGARLERGQTDDVLQSTFLSAWKALDAFEYRGPDSFRRWLGVILSHKLADHARGEAREREGLESLRDEIGTAPVDESPSARIARDETHARLLGALASLSLEEQELIGLRFFDHLSWPEVAQRLGVAESTARRRMVDALESLMRRTS